MTNGNEIYPRRPDLAYKKFWRCDGCQNYVGCHPGRVTPLGSIPTRELRNARNHIHKILDPLWKEGRFARGDIYAALTEHLGRQYHTAEIQSLDEARSVCRMVQRIARDGLPGRGAADVPLSAASAEVVGRVERSGPAVIARGAPGSAASASVNPSEDAT